ncbi:glutamine amidotransferase [Pseudomonas sp. COR58]|uniref:Glutamine amidotransferase n=1 Tax=Pseudomonas ekonensis TaxID=2842353 RepID=A0ABS6PLQ5_9PSED|nr:glutamine amidotransferase [Pseudomonas ekonensis]MBV4461407.1 glutamine amidotransferase [Pseudomonas ekonensis]
MSRLPIIGVTDGFQQSGLHAHHISGDTSARSAAGKARSLWKGLLSPAEKAPASGIQDARDGIPFSGSPFNIDRFHSSGLCGVRRGAHDSAHPRSAQEMQRQRKGQVSSSFIVDARCPA